MTSTRTYQMMMAALMVLQVIAMIRHFHSYQFVIFCVAASGIFQTQAEVYRNRAQALERKNRQ